MHREGAEAEEHMFQRRVQQLSRDRFRAQAGQELWKIWMLGLSVPSFVGLLDVKKRNTPITTAIKDGRYVVSQDREVRASGRILGDVLKAGHRSREKWF